MKRLILSSLCLLILSPVFSQGVWTWMGGSKYANDSGKYVGDSLWPKARNSSCLAGTEDGVYLFGGMTSSDKKWALMNDLWYWNGEEWHWLSGSDTSKNLGYFRGNNIPHARMECACHYDTAVDEFFVFGGRSYVYSEDYSMPVSGLSNALWKWNGKDWVLLRGDSTLNGRSRYSDSSGWKKTPPSMTGPIYWTNSEGQFNIYGGNVIDSSFKYPYFYTNEWWQYDSTGWHVKQAASNVYYYSSKAKYPKEKGVFTEGAHPGRRRSSATSTNKSGDLFIYGGLAVIDAVGQDLKRSDLWTTNGTDWAWLAGDTTFDKRSKYCTQNGNLKCHPGATWSAMAWVDQKDHFWMFSDDIEDSKYPSEFWKWDGSHWEMVNKDKWTYTKGVYGVMGQADTSNWPGARRSAVTWKDKNGDMWMFGGIGYDSDGDWGYLNDLWKFSPDTTEEVSVAANYAASQLQVYPNPARGMMTVQLSSNTPHHLLSIVNTQGQVIWQQKVEQASTQIATHHWPSGLYILKCQTTDKVIEKKIIIRN